MKTGVHQKKSGGKVRRTHQAEVLDPLFTEKTKEGR